MVTELNQLRAEREGGPVADIQLLKRRFWRCVPAMDRVSIGHYLRTVSHTPNSRESTSEEWTLLQASMAELVQAATAAETSLRLPSRALLSHVITEAEQVLRTNWSNFLKYGTFNHMKQYLRAKYQLNKSQAAALRAALLSESQPRSPDLVQHYHNELALVQGFGVADFMHGTDNVLDPAEQERNMVVFRYMMLKTVEASDLPIKRFTLVPVCRVQYPMINVSRSCLELWGYDGGRGWEKIFTKKVNNIAKKGHTNGRTKAFARHFRTDGLSVVVVVEEVILARPDNNYIGQGERCATKPSQFDPRNTVGVDPGRIFVVYANILERGRKRTFSLHLSAYRDRCGFTKRNILAHQWLSRAPNNLQQKLNDRAISLKLTSVDRLQAAIGTRLTFLSNAIDFFGQRRWRRKGLETFGRKQRTMEFIASKLFPTASHIVFYGAANFPSGIRGRPPGPCIGLKRFLVTKTTPGRFFFVDEYNTSKMCAACSQKNISTALRRVHKSDRSRGNGPPSKKGRPQYGVLSCPKCSMEVPRDDNGSDNILAIASAFLHAQNWSVPREIWPPALRRPL
ncbi:hypothetical protein HOP50_05g36300 [Chloropicon primus]|uniref:Cas12f1-like TNB domain-containing protein n=1 Tax=Chloropicon primus TaxID=1764295 RepID=A0A5B8MP47_9CHLO|nr:hypothetical protein A3770_04p28570 [Chloropicon primus]QDZ21102.1 hypothetical protein A3770_05p36200 [Chloropicon primus]UPR00316.1 hypothetical protein HOP50_05g36300 [Chloropicon primus]|eukprot:QDZ20339.1 hypothetical protein A3770_04p28570 [Chloropicon primus]